MTSRFPSPRDRRHTVARRMLALAAVLATLAVPMAPAAAQGPTPSAARSPRADTLALTLEDAVRRAGSQSEEVRLAQRQVELADAQITTARSQALPQLNGRINYTRTFRSPFQGGGFTTPDSLQFAPDTTRTLAERVSYLENNADLAGLTGLGSLFGNLPFGQANAYTVALSGSQLLYSGGRVGAALDIAGSFRDVAELTLVEQAAAVEHGVRTAYARAALAGELVAISRAALEQAERFLADQTLRHEAGTASELDVLRAEVSAQNLRPALLEAENAADLAIRELKRLVNVPAEQPIRLTTALAAPSAAVLADSVPPPASQLARRASVAAAERQVDIQEGQVRIARGAYLPNVSLSFNLGSQLFPEEVFQRGSAQWRDDWTAGLEVSLPLFTGLRRRGEVQEARVNLERSRLQLAQLRESVALEYQQAAAERARALSAIGARSRTVEQAEKVYDLTVLRYDQGLATQLEVSQSRLELLQARTNLVQAVADFHVAEADVARSLAGTTAAESAP